MRDSLRDTTMGMNNLKPQLPWTILRDWVKAFPGSTFLIDAANILYCFALENFETFTAGDLEPAVADFAKYMRFLVARKVPMVVIFDGLENAWKNPESQRRRAIREKHQAVVDAARAEDKEPDEKDLKGTVYNTPLYIAMCAKCCKTFQISYMIARKEADSQLAAIWLSNPAKYIVVSADTDMLGLGIKKWVSIKSWWGGSAVYIDVVGLGSYVPVLLSDGKDKYPLVRHVVRHGTAVFQIWGAVRGCDGSEHKCGIQGVGETTLLAILDDIYEASAELTVEAVASKVRCDGSMDTQWVQGEMERVIAGFTDAEYYRDDGAVLSLKDNEAVVVPASAETLAHMAGERDPKTGMPFGGLESQEALTSLKPGLLTHNNTIDPSSVPGGVLPKPLGECGVADLRSFITARGGTSSGMDKRDLQLVVQDYLNVEDELPPNLIDRSDTSGLMLKKIETTHGTPAWSVLKKLLATEEVKENKDPWALVNFLQPIYDSYSEKTITEDQDDIICNAPEMTEEIVQLLYSPMGGADEKKSSRESFQKSADQDGVIYHANVTNYQKKTVTVVSKQGASLSKDETTRNQTEGGEKPLPIEYLCLVELMWEETDDSTHGHTLGVVTGVGRSWCMCTAGRGLCVHKGMALWAQIHHWGPDRPTDMPATSSLCGWCRGSKKRSHSAVKPVGGITFVVTEKDKVNKKHRACRESEEGGATYNPIPEGDQALFDKLVKPGIFAGLYDEIAAQRQWC